MKEIGRDLPDIDADVLADIMNFPGGDPLLELKNEDQREGARQMLHWLLADIGADGIAVKVTALRYLMRMERRSMEKVARRLHVKRAVISKQCTRLADSLGLPGLRSRTSREIYRRAALNAWEKRKGKFHGDNGQI